MSRIRPEPTRLTERERELGAIISAYNEVTEKLKESHIQLQTEVHRLRVELENKNRELARRERLAALGEMAAGLAHEIRNPLGGIQLFAGLLVRDLVELPKPRALAEKIKKGVNSLESIVSDILAFAGQNEPRFAEVELTHLIQESIEMAVGAMEENGAGVRWLRDETGADDLMIEADPYQLQQALLNLLKNAAEAAGRGGCVDISTKLDGDQVTLVIADNGEGIPADLLDRIFNPFFTTKDKGTGLGLAIVHRIIEAHGGSIRASNRESGGAIFSLSLPRRQNADADPQLENM